MTRLEKKPLVSVVMPLPRESSGFLEELGAVRSAFEASQRAFEIIVVVDGRGNQSLPALRELQNESRGVVSLIVLSKRFGESTALVAGLRQARGESILALTENWQVKPASLSMAIEQLETQDVDVLAGRRYPRRDSMLNRAQSAAFHWVVQRLTGSRFRDLSCGVWAMRRRVAEKLTLYGDLHRFIPILASNLGFEVGEVDLEHRLRGGRLQFFGVGAYFRRVVDALTVFFLVRFTRKPLRLFGTIGLISVAVGGGLTLYLGIYRLFGVGGIADRPMLLLGLLLIVIGVQSISMGLLGELIIFTHARKVTQYRVAEVVEGAAEQPVARRDAEATRFGTPVRAAGSETTGPPRPEG